MRKIIITVFLLTITSISLSKEISIIVKDKYRTPIKEVTVKVNNETRLTNQNGEVFFNSEEENIKININKDGFEEKNIEIFNLNQDHLNIELEEAEIDKQFLYLVVRFSEYLDSFYFLDELATESNYAKNSIVNFYKDDTLVRSIDYNSSVLPILLEYGEYSIKVFNIYKNDLEFNNININKDSNGFLVLNIKRETFLISGKVITEKAFLGGVTINFDDGFGNIFTTKTNIEGDYSVSLPENNYMVKAEKIGYQLLGEHSIFVNENSGNYNINMGEIGSYLSGIIVDQDNKPLKNVEVTFGSSLSESLTVESNELGLFKAQVPKGMVLIRASKDGYYSSGTLKRVENYSTMEGIKIELKQKVGLIKGYLVNNIKAAENFNLKLFNSNGEFLGNSKTNEKGFYEFASLPIWDKYYISIEKNEKEYYRSEIITIKENEKFNLDIIIDIESINLIIEVVDDNTLLSNAKVIINNLEYKSDINGFVNQYFETDELEELTIELPDYDITEVIKLNNKIKSPLKLKYDVSK